MRIQEIIGFGITSLWLVAVGAGFYTLIKYDTTPGVIADGPQIRPQDSIINPSRHTSNLIMFVHPQCACTRASLGELAKLMAHEKNRLTAFVLFLSPAGHNWRGSDLWSLASAIPGVTVIEDRNGVEAKRFGAITSGQVLVYNVQGRLVFNGGITSARGHSGDNFGVSAIASKLEPGAVATKQKCTDVFGCPLVDASQAN